MHDRFKLRGATMITTAYVSMQYMYTGCYIIHACLQCEVMQFLYYMACSRGIFGRCMANSIFMLMPWRRQFFLSKVGTSTCLFSLVYSAYKKIYVMYIYGM